MPLKGFRDGKNKNKEQIQDFRRVISLLFSLARRCPNGRESKEPNAYESSFCYSLLELNVSRDHVVCSRL